jgi:hypothetical protein
MVEQTNLGSEDIQAPVGTKVPQIENKKLVGDIAFVIIFAYTSYTATSYPTLARIFPLCVSLLAVALSLVNLGLDIKRRFATADIAKAKPQASRPKELEDDEIDPEISKADIAGVLKAWGWIFGFVAAIALLGLEIAAALFIFSVLRLNARQSYRFATIAAALAVSGVAAFSKFLDVPIPEPFWWPS